MKEKEFQQAIISTIDKIEAIKEEMNNTIDPQRKHRLRNKLQELFNIRLQYLNRIEVK